MLYKLIEENIKSRFINAAEKQRYLLDDILFDLSDISFSKNNLSFLYVKNRIEQVGLYFSLLKTSSAIVLLNETLNNELKRFLEEKYKPFIIFDNHRKSINDYDNKVITSSVFSINIFISKNKKSIKIHSNIKLLLSTSGTTGSPKFVKLSENNLIENAKSILDYLPINEKDTTPLNLPFYYSYGLSVLHTNAIAGADIVCDVADILQREFWDEFSEFGYTSISGVPYIYEMLNRIGFRKKKHSSLKYCTQAGGNLNEKTKRLFIDYFKENKIKFFVMYGQTEATARISYVPPDKLQENITSIGIPINNGVLKIDKNTNELLYKGPNIFGGYARNPEDLQKWESKEILHTGDIAVEQNGFYIIKGRLKRFVKLFGNRINLDEIETLLKNNFPGILFASVGLNDKKLIVAFNDKNIGKKEVSDFIYKRLKIHSSVIKPIFLETFPLTDNGKIDYQKIIQLYESK